MTLSQVIKLLPVIWIGGFIVAIPTILEYSVYIINNTSNNTTAVCGNSFVEPILTMLNCMFVTVVSFVTPLILMFNNYTRIIVFVNKRCSRITALVGNDVKTSGQVSVGISSNNLPVHGSHLSKNRIKIVKMLVLMAVAFVLCWLPFCLLYVYSVSIIIVNNTLIN
jgi:Sec-independent protein secretion pathway component TatC